MTAKRWTLLAAVLGSAIVFLDSTVVNVALPRIGRDLPRLFVGTLEGQSYVFNAYLVSLSALLILAGALNDYFGRKRMFGFGLIGFGATSVLCGVAPNMELLIAFRVLQGAAGALLVPGSLSLISAAFTGEEQGRAYGVWAGASAGTTILGPFVGGLLVDTVSWRAAFLINVPLVALAMYALYTHVRESRDEEASGKFDWLGAVVVALGIGGLSFGGIYGAQRNWSDPIAFVALAIGLLATAVFPLLMLRSKHPLVPLGLFRSRNFTVTNISTLVIYGALYITFSNFIIYQQGTLGYTAAAAGLGGVPGTLFLVFFSARFGGLAVRIGPRVFMAVGPLLMGLGVLWFARIPSSSQPWMLNPNNPATFPPPGSFLIDFLPGSVIFGVGLMMMVAPLTTALMASVPVHNSGVASAINNAISRVGPILVGAVIFVAVTAGFYSTLATRLPGVDVNSPDVRAVISPLNQPAEQKGSKPVLSSDPTVRRRQLEAVRQASTTALHLAMLISAGLLFVGAAVNALGIRNPERPPTQAGASTPG